MDYYNFNPIGADYLDFLGPSTQRGIGFIDSGYNPQRSRSDNSQFISKESLDTGYQRPNINSSTSLILKKTTEREINQYSDFSYHNQYSSFLHSLPPKLKSSKNRPLIKVTVIPNNVPTQNKSSKRSLSHLRLQRSVSNRENSIKAKNVFLIIAGKRREKIYEIKTTGSTDLSVSDNEFRYNKQNATVEHNISQLLSSLNMDRKKKGKKRKDKEDRDGSGSSLLNGQNVIEGMQKDLENYNISLNNRRSRVRITGRIGLTEDDRYVMKCAATVDGKPVEASYTQEQRFDNYSVPSVPWDEQPIRCCQKNKIMNSTQQKEANVQANLDSEDKCINACNNCPLFMFPCNAFRSVETQCSPANFNTVCFSNIDQLRIVSTNKDQLFQCECAQTTASPKMESENEKMYPPKNCHSPLVIISVYPKQDSTEKDSDVSPTVTRKLSPKRNGKRVSTDSPNKSPKSRSPSPTKGRSKGKTETNTKKTKGQITTATGTDKTSRKVKVTQETNSKFSSTSKGVSNKFQVNSSLNRSANKREANVQANLSYDGSFSPTRQKGKTEANKGQLNTNMLAARINNKQTNWVTAEKDESNVTINIDGENDVYDVLYRQDGLTTDLRVRKTIKDQGSQKYALDDGSLENFLLVSDSKRKRSFSQTFIFANDQSNVNADVAFEKTLPAIAVRDSIEVSHRREEKTSDPLIYPPSTTTCFTSTESKNRNFSAPIKHYRGDRCELFNPVERDKEIRELLGIQKHKPIITKKNEMPTIKSKGECSLHCIFHSKRNNNVTSTALYNRITGAYNCTCEDGDLIEANGENEEDAECNICSNSNSTEDFANSKHRLSSRHHSRYPIEEDTNKLQYTKRATIIRDHSNTSFIDEEIELEANHEGKRCKIVQCKAINKHPLYQQLILNRNINIYLQIEQFTKQKPIVLSRKQYNKVKRTIENAGLKPKLHCICKRRSSGFTVGEVRRKTAKSFHEYSDKGEQFDGIYKRISDPRKSQKSAHIQSDQKEFNNYSRILRKSTGGGNANGLNNYKVSKNFGQFASKEEFYHHNKITKKSTSSSSGEPEIDNHQKETKKLAVINLDEEVLDDHHRKSKKVSRISSIGKGEIYNHLRKSRRNITRTSAAGDGTEIGKLISSKINDFDEDKPILRRETSIDTEGDQMDQSGIVKGRTKNKKQYVREKLSTKASKFFEDLGREKFKTLRDSLKIKVENNNCARDCCRTCGEPVERHCCGNCGRKTKKVCPNWHSTCYHCAIGKQNNDVSVDRSGPVAASRHAVSTTEVRYTSVAVMKHVTFSSTDFVEKERKPSVANVLLKNYESDSLHTLFKGHRKSPTPNLGTSAFSLFSDNSDYSSRDKLEAKESRPRKPFLRRLMSCLVMRSRTSDIEIVKPITKLTSVNSSIDSYHINSSLGCIELSSSIYDTSASFFSSHSIQPITSKMKRGFFNSVREFLTNRRN